MAEDDPRSPDPTAAAANASGDETPAEPAAMPPAGPRADETGEQAPPAIPAATPAVGPSGTSVLPAVSDADEPPRWSARARVAPPDVADTSEQYPEAWAEPPRGPLVPILIGVCILLVLALAALGTWLALSNRNGTPQAPQTPAATATIATTTTRPAPTTAVPTTSAPPSLVALPDLKGTDYDSAANALKALGFVPARRDELNTQVPAGTVAGTDPPAGTLVRPGATINIIVSTGPPKSSTPKPTSSGPGPTHT